MEETDVVEEAKEAENPEGLRTWRRLRRQTRQ